MCGCSRFASRSAGVGVRSGNHMCVRRGTLTPPPHRHPPPLRHPYDQACCTRLANSSPTPPSVRTPLRCTRLANSSQQWSRAWQSLHRLGHTNR
eukprot:224163-Chlamydomonas_euryale.AAC.2